ncbi:MAG TPA: hypothetical protein VKB12_06750 [Pyrinomonadaceae bacterium]|nr:hypothetical protein [Pyrinomonadaceae bacterium]
MTGLYKKATHALRYLLLRRLPTCRQTVSVISQSLERSLTLRERVMTKLHLWVCIWCVRYLEQLQLMRGALRARGSKLPDEDAAADASLSAEARERMKRALSQRSH